MKQQKKKQLKSRMEYCLHRHHDKAVSVEHSLTA